MPARRWFVGVVTLLVLVGSAIPAQAVSPSSAPAPSRVTAVKSAATPPPVGKAATDRKGTSGSRSSRLPTNPATGRPAVQAAGAAGNPAKNIPPSPAFPDRCYQAYQSVACTTAGVAALNNARRVMGLPAYVLPAGFALMSPAYQFLALSNADRKVAGLSAITAFNPTVNSVALASAKASVDPSATTVPTVIAGQRFSAWTANWAGGMSPLEAYYDWMYYDGYGSNNVDCVLATDTGCWGHRQNTLWNFGAAEVTMGVGTAFTGADYGTSWTELYWAYTPTTTHIPRLPAVLSATAGGPAAGGTTVTVTGYGLETATAVLFGSKSVAPSSKTAGRLTVTAPPGTGVVSLRVTGNGGTSPAWPGTTYSYLAPVGAGSFVPQTPIRFLDTRTGVGARKARVSSHATVQLQVAGRGAVPATGAGWVALNLTVAGPTAAGSVNVYAGGTARRAIPNLSYLKGQTVANLVMVPIGRNGKVNFYNDSAGTLDLVVDVSGYYRAGTSAAAGSFVGLATARFLDTRTGNGAAKARVGKSATLKFLIGGRGGVPRGVSAVVFNVTVVNPTGAGHLTVYGSGSARPSSANQNFVARQSVSSLIVSAVGADGKVAIFNGSSGSIDLVADVVGYVRGGVANTRGAIVPITPARTYDTRYGIGVGTVPPYDFSPPAGQQFVVDSRYQVPLLVTGRRGVPATGVAAVVLTVTVLAPRAAGSYTAFPDGTAVPGTSVLSFRAGVTVSNTVIVPVARNGLVDLYNGSASFNGLAVDVAGYVLG